MEKYLRKIGVGLAASAVICLFAVSAEASFSLSVSPYQGGYDLDFGKVGAVDQGINREVSVRITSTSSKQYRLIQTFYEPFVNAEGVSLSSARSLVVYAIRGSNQYGSLSVENEQPVSLSRAVLYTSNREGLSDAFTLVYAVKGPFSVPAGLYRGRLGFSLEAVDASESPVTVFLNLVANIETQSSIAISSASGSKTIRLNSASDMQRDAAINVAVQGSAGRQFSLFQALSGPLVSMEGQELDTEALEYSINGVRRGTAPGGIQPVSSAEQILYTSDSQGRADEFQIVYSLGASASAAKAGLYRAKLNYGLQSSIGTGRQQLDTYLLEVDIPKAFDLEISTDSSTGSLSFRDLRPGQAARTCEVSFTVKSNIGKRYIVTQKVMSDLTSKSGKSIPADNFVMSAQKQPVSQATVKIGGRTPVVSGETVLFVSDSKGSADSFSVVYELSVPADVQAADYTTSVVYSLSEL